MVSQWNSSGIFPRIHHMAALQQSPGVPVKKSKEPEDFTGRIIFMSMFNDISWRSKDNEQECELSSQLVSICAKRFSPGRWSLLGPGSEKLYSTHESRATRRMGQSRRTDDDGIFRKRTPRFPCCGSIVPRNAQKQRWWTIDQYTFALIRERLKLFFATIISVNQLSIDGAVSDLWEQCKVCHVRKGRPVLAGQSDPLFVPTSVMKISTLLTDDPAQEDLLQKYQERVERLSQQNRVINFCTDAGFLTTFEVGQYFMTKAHWRILTIYRVSGLSWVHFAKRWKIIWPERLDSSEHQDWFRIGSHNQLNTR